MYKTHETLGKVYQLSDQLFAIDKDAPPYAIEHRGQVFYAEHARESKGYRGKVAVVKASDDGGVEKPVFLVNASALR